jgi:beta-carotene/zeaxanthin 4-ketolase
LKDRRSLVEGVFLLRRVDIEQSESKNWDNAIGGIIAIAIISIWIGSLVVLLPMNLGGINWGWILLGIFARTFFQTGLFILAHDAMHQSLLPSHPTWNDRIGALSLWLYAMLPYQICRSNHARHHQHPAQIGDPDFHDGTHTNPLQWYLKFMREYLSPQQCALFLTVICGVGSIAIRLYDISPLNLALWWILPLSLSSIQLFIFGTYLPHRHSGDNTHRARTINYPLCLSFLSCYHFGYHWEHHEYPRTPWYKIPAIYLKTRSFGQNMSK